MDYHSYYILAFGSNQGNTHKNFEQGFDFLKNYGQFSFRGEAISTKSLIPEFPDFLNCICGFWTNLLPKDLYVKISTIENQVGHPRHEKWASRELDIDILFYWKDQNFVNYTSKKHNLYIPHKEITKRPFLKDLLLMSETQWPFGNLEVRRSILL
jgi:2-amino-4-hydroxy-6-hydroxymethyldihydropteridine diphosphokinase